MMSSKLQTNLAREIIGYPEIIEFLNSDLPLEGIFELKNNLPSHRTETYRSLYFGVGKTAFYKMPLENNNMLHIKMEYANRMGNTHYSRFWLIYLFLCEHCGVIHPKSSEIIEVTSGSSGIALSLACKELQFYATILVPEMLPESRVSPMRNNYVSVIRVPGYVPECISKMQQMIKGGDYFATNHSEEKAGIIIYVFKRIASEVIAEKIKFDYAVLALGNGTTTLSIGKRLKEEYPNLICDAYKPNFNENPNSIVFGLVVPNINFRHMKKALSFVDNLLYTNGVDLSIIKKQYSFDTEITNFGYTSLYGLYFALEYAKKHSNSNLLSIAYDKIDRY